MGEQCGDRVVIEPGVVSPANPMLELPFEGSIAGRLDRRRHLRRDEGPQSGPADDQALVLEVAIGAMDGVRIDRDLANDLFNRGQSVAGFQQAEEQGTADLLDELDVIRNARVRIEVEGD